MSKLPSPHRVSEKLIKDMKNVTLERINRGLANPLKKDEISLREMTDLLTRTNSYKTALLELKTKPKGNK